MIVDKAILKGYKRLYVSGINNIEYEPKNKLQIILGTNGSGKSSLLKEMIPNVENIKDEYDQNGHKYIRYIHKDDIIEIEYDRGTNRHSFKINNEELNPSGLIKIQKQLIDQYFGLNKDISELLLSNINFTTMTVNERKKWFTEILSNIDYSYALNLFNKAKQRNRDLNAYIKLIKSKMLEYTKILDEYNKDNIEDIKQDINLLNKLLAHLLELKQPYKDIDIESIKNKLKPILKEGSELINSLTKQNLTKSSILTKLTSIKTELDLLTKEKNEILEKINKLEQLKISEDDDKEKLIKQVNELENKLKEIKELNIYNLNLNNIDEIYIKYNEILPYLTEIHSELTGLHIDTDNYKSKHSLYRDKLADIKSKINEYETKKELLKNHIEEHIKNDHVTCPKCGYSFIPGLDNIDNIKKEYEKINTILNKLKQEYKEIRDMYDKLDSYINNIKRIKDYFITNNLDKIYEYIKVKTNDFTNIGNLQSILDKIMLDLESMSNYKEYLNELEELKYKLSIFDRIDDSKLNKIFDKLNQLRDSYSKIIERLNFLNQEYSRYNNYNNLVNRLEEILNIVEKYVKSLNNIKENMILKEQNKLLTETITVIKSEITNLEEKLNKIKNLNEQYEELKKELDDYNKRYIATSKLVELLSPNKGIIARSITTLINDILERMNDIINKVWSYNINIEPCDIEESDLTYRFPVKINNSKVISDVSKGSSSIREIIDLAFKIVAMEYLDMLDYPLILDEFGRTMDPVHRIKAYDLIEELSMNYFSQIYLVSHYESMYGRFVNADVIVLDDNNIEYSGKYNEVIKIDRN